jgi:hypothetical protein
MYLNSIAFHKTPINHVCFTVAKGVDFRHISTAPPKYLKDLYSFYILHIYTQTNTTSK